MIAELIQKRPFIKRKGIIYENKIDYESTYFGRKLGATIYYEDLTCSKSSHFQNKLLLLIPMVTCFLFSFVAFQYKNDPDFHNPTAWVYWGIAFLIATFFYGLTVENMWKIKVQNNTFLFFLKSTPNKKAVDDFIQTLFDTRNLYLRETYYSEPSKLLSYQTQKDNLKWLRRNEVITREEFIENNTKLEALFVHEVKKVGFN